MTTTQQILLNYFREKNFPTTAQEPRTLDFPICSATTFLTPQQIVTTLRLLHRNNHIVLSLEKLSLFRTAYNIQVVTT